MDRPKRITRADINLGTVRWEESLALVGLLGHWIGPGVCELHGSAASPWPDEGFVARRELPTFVNLPFAVRSANPDFYVAVAPAWVVPWLEKHPGLAPVLNAVAVGALQRLGPEGRRALGDVYRISTTGYWHAFTAATGIPRRGNASAHPMHVPSV